MVAISAAGESTRRLVLRHLVTKELPSENCANSKELIVKFRLMQNTVYRKQLRYISIAIVIISSGT